MQELEPSKSDKLVAKLQTSSAPNIADELKPAKNAISLINSNDYLSQIKRASPKHVAPEKLVRYATTEIKDNPALLKCDPYTVASAILRCAEIGLMPGKTLGEAYLIPYNNTATLQIGYKGLVRLAFNSGQIKSIYAHCVYSNDVFNYNLGLAPNIEHIPALTGGRGNFTHVYCVAIFNNATQFEVMNFAEVEQIRTLAKNSNAWVDFYSEMAKKTVLKRLVKYLPISVELQSAVSLDDLGDIVKQDGQNNNLNENYLMNIEG